jgi:hypothetical protein
VPAAARLQDDHRPKHSLKRHPNLLNDVELYALDQAWVADISYVRLPTTVFRQRTPDGREVTRGEGALKLIVRLHGATRRFFR